MLFLGYQVRERAARSVSLCGTKGWRRRLEGTEGTKEWEAVRGR